MEETLKIWTTSESIKIDRPTETIIDTNTILTIKDTSKNYPSTTFLIERKVTLADYQAGRIGKYANELPIQFINYIQLHSIAHRLQYNAPVLRNQIHNNETELHAKFRAYCETNSLETLMKPTISSIEIVYDEASSDNIVKLLEQIETFDGDLLQIVNTYNTAISQDSGLNKFLLLFICLELLASKFISRNKLSWKQENNEDYGAIVANLPEILKNKYEYKLNAIRSMLSEYSLIDKLKLYFSDIFSKDEIEYFWSDESWAIPNAEHKWKELKRLNINIFKTLRELKNIRDDIMHKGEFQIEGNDNNILESILRRVLYKEIAISKTKTSI